MDQYGTSPEAVRAPEPEVNPEVKPFSLDELGLNAPTGSGEQSQKDENVANEVEALLRSLEQATMGHLETTQAQGEAAAQTLNITARELAEVGNAEAIRGITNVATTVLDKARGTSGLSIADRVRAKVTQPQS